MHKHNIDTCVDVYTYIHSYDDINLEYNEMMNDFMNNLNV